MVHIIILSCMQARSLALGPRFGLVVIAQGQGFGSRESIWADFEIFEVLGGAGDIYNSITTPNYCDEPYSALVRYVNKVLSALTEVWNGSYRARAYPSRSRRARMEIQVARLKLITELFL